MQQEDPSGDGARHVEGASSVTSIANLPVIDLTAWRSEDPALRAALADEVDAALQTFGFLLLVGHGIDPQLAKATRSLAEQFFALSEAVKRPYAATTGGAGAGWLPLGAESNSYASGISAPPDLKETFSVFEAGDPARPEVLVAEVPDLAPTARAYFEASWSVALELYELFSAALHLPESSISSHTARPNSALKINLYPPLSVTGPPQPGQSRSGAHSDFGVVTLLDRQPGYAGLQVQFEDGSWADAPYLEGALTINIGDLLARWTGDRWRSTVHRVLPPSEQAPDEALVSLIHFTGVKEDTLIETLPVGGPTRYEPVVARDYIDAKMKAIYVA